MNYIFGKKALVEAISQNKVQEIYSLNNNEFVKEVKNKVKVIFKDQKFFSNFKNVNHQNLIGLLKDNIKIYDGIESYFENETLENKESFLMLDEIQDPGNFGAICRTCSALDVKTIIYKKNNQVQINDTVIKTSLGTVNNIKFVRVNNLVNTLEFLKNKGFWSLCTSLNEKSIDLQKFKTKFDKYVLIVGNEENGVSQLVQKKSDISLKIEMKNNVQSLNVSVATAIFLYHLKNL